MPNSYHSKQDLADTGLATRTDELLREARDTVYRRTDRMFAILMVFQWLATIVAANWISPYAWSGTNIELHIHVKLAIVLGGLLTALPVFLAVRFPGHIVTRNVICMAQVLFSGLLIHVTGGRIETHFHIFGSLAFIAMYRDWKLLIPATMILVVDHIGRGWLWPQSIYGVAFVQKWLWLEHAAWVVFENTFLIISCRFSVQEMWKTATRQAQLESNNRTVEQKIEERTLELKAAATAALAASTAKSQFLANMSHEIRTPMNGIIGLTDLLLETELQSPQRRQLELVQTSADALMSVLNDILDYSKIEAGKFRLDPVPFDLRDAVGDVMKLFGLRAFEKGVELAFRVKQNVPQCVVGDPGRLRQVLVNLVGNAVKFTSEGEVYLSVGIGERTDENIELIFEVEDTGIGISAEKQASIFEAFTQADGSMTRQFGGTGLGLTISRRLVEMMGGNVSVQSQLGSGSQFRFTVHLEEVSEPRETRGSYGEDALRGLRVLVVDDHSTNRLILREMTTNWGMLPTVVDGGEGAIKELRIAAQGNQPFSLVLLDAHMPDIDGFEVANRIRNELGNSDITLIMLSSDDCANRRDHRLKLKIAAQLVKPIKQSELFDSIVTEIVLPDDAAGLSDSNQAADSESTGKVNLAPLHVLVAEDNAINQHLMMSILKRDGHEVVMANNGQEAVDLWAEQEFDVILMDVQMPKVDGFQATSLIRGREGDGPRMPIVALTAHAMKGDRERCLNAGMDDYVSKPVYVDKLRDVLAKLLPHRVVELEEQADTISDDKDGSREDESLESSSNTSEIAASPRFDRQDFMERIGGDHALVVMAAEMFPCDGAEQLALVRAALQDGDADKLKRAAHSLKGTAANIGGVRTAEAAYSVEQFGKNDQLKDADAAVEELASELELLTAELREFALEINPAVS